MIGGRALSGHGMPAAAAPGPLLGDDHAVLEDLTAPDPVGLGPLDGARQAGLTNRAGSEWALARLRLGRLA